MSDTMKHVAVCFFLAVVLMALARIMKSDLVISLGSVAVFVMFVGAMKETFDAFTPGNRWDWHDIGADAVGCFLGLAIGALFWLC